MPDGLVLRDLGEKKWQGTKGGEEFHRTFLSIINYLVGQDHHGVTLYYEGGNRGTTARTRPPILDFDPLPDTAGRLSKCCPKFVGDWGPHYGSKETFTYAQTVPMLNWLATIVSRDPEMRDLIVHPPPRVRRFSDVGIELRPYQVEAVERIVDRRNLLLAMVMGSGKTVTAVAAVAHPASPAGIARHGAVFALKSTKLQWVQGDHAGRSHGPRCR